MARRTISVEINGNTTCFNIYQDFYSSDILVRAYDGMTNEMLNAGECIRIKSEDFPQFKSEYDEWRWLAVKFGNRLLGRVKPWIYRKTYDFYAVLLTACGREKLMAFIMTNEPKIEKWEAVYTAAVRDIMYCQYPVSYTLDKNTLYFTGDDFERILANSFYVHYL